MAADLDGLCRDCPWTGPAAGNRCPRCGSPRIVRHPELRRLGLAHLDCDAFYASVEKRDAPALRDRPLIVGGGRRGVVTTACYIARLSGVRSAMPMFKALRLCPEAVVVAPAFAKYRVESRRIMEMARALTPLVQPLALDEAWLDLTGTERLHGRSPAATLVALQARIERDIGITVSIGLAPNKFLAKIASEMDKPRGFGVIGAAEARGYLAPKPVTLLPGVGPAVAASLASRGFRTIADLTAADPADVFRALGPSGPRLLKLARGLDDRPVDPSGGRKTMSAETTFDVDLTGVAALEARLWPLCERVARQARTEGLAGRTVVLKLRRADFRILTRRRPADTPTQTARTLFEVARALLRDTAAGEAFRLVGVGLADLVVAGDAADMFGADEARALHEETTMDSLRGRFGDGVIVRGRDLRG